MKTKCIALFVCFVCFLHAQEKIDLEIISYEDFVRADDETRERLISALYDSGIVGIKGIPGYRSLVHQFIDTSIAFSKLPEEVKEQYSPHYDEGEDAIFVGYERGKEKFQLDDGSWIIDDLKVSYYAYIPDQTVNKWPREIALQETFTKLCMLMSEVGEKIMYMVGILGEKTGIHLNENSPRLGRMLYYAKNQESENPYWCGAHFDHSIFTALLPAFYYREGQRIEEPEEAGLFVKRGSDEEYRKVVADDDDVLFFQVGEFGQLATNDAIRATEHRVHKAKGAIERYTLALFFDAPPEAVIYSHSVLTEDSRYDGNAGDPCSYAHWGQASFDRYLVKEES